MKKVTIYGERCSGTNYLEKLLILNFNVDITWSYGWKHFFGSNNLSNSDDVLFIGIIRNLEDWVNSLYREKHHLPSKLTKNIKTFLNDTFYSVDKNIVIDKNIETGELYKNIFELRHVKNKFLIEKMPTLVKNYCLITHEDLCNNFINTMNKISNCGLIVKNNIKFPLNVTYYKTNKKKQYKKKENLIPRKKIIRRANLFYEKILFPESVF
jgi:hypothetical protein